MNACNNWEDHVPAFKIKSPFSERAFHMYVSFSGKVQTRHSNVQLYAFDDVH